MAYGNLKFDTLTTSDAKNTSTEKSIDTSYIFNGVAKHIIHHDDGATIRDSFNNSSLTDHAAGKHTNTVTNNFSNIYYSYYGTVGAEAYNSCYAAETSAPTTSAYRYGFVNHGNGTFYDNTYSMMTAHGDLA